MYIRRMKILVGRGRDSPHIKKYIKRILTGFVVLLIGIGYTSNSLINAKADTYTNTSDYTKAAWYEDTKWYKMNSASLGSPLSMKDITTYGKNYTDIFQRNQSDEQWHKMGFRNTAVRNIITKWNSNPEDRAHYSYWASDPDYSHKPTAWVQHFYDDAITDDSTRLLYQKKIEVTSGQVINIVAATQDTVTDSGKSLAGNNQFYWSVIELNELGEIVFDSAWLKTNQTWTVGVDTGGFSNPKNVSNSDRQSQVKYVIPVMRWDNNDASIGSGSTSINAATVNASYPVFYIVGTPFTYTFDSNGGNKGTYTRSRTGLGSLNAAIEEPTRAGYRFAGWKVQGAATTDNLQKGQVYSTSTLQSMINSGEYWSSLFGNATFTAQWESPYTYTVNYVSENTGITLHNPTTITDYIGNSQTVDPPVITGYDTPDSKTVIFDTDDKVITFSYIPTIYYIDYTLNGGSLNNQRTEYNIETETFTVPEPSRMGYTFTGWAGTDIDAAAISVTISAGSVGNRSYTAIWKSNKYLITFDLNKPERASSIPRLNVQNTKAIEYDSKMLSLPNKTVTLLTGWTFAGWYTNADGGIEVKNGDTFSWTNDITLYAHWIENMYMLHFDTNGGTASHDVDVKYEDSVTLPAAPFRPGHNFKLWNTMHDGSGISYKASQTVIHLTTEGTINLFGIWNKKSRVGIGAAKTTVDNNGYEFGRISDETAASLRTYFIDEDGYVQN